MVIALVVVSALLAVCLYLLLMGKKDAPVATRTSSASTETSSSSAAVSRGDDSRKLEAELKKKSDELAEVKKAQHELKDELKTLKKKLHDQREAEKSGDDLAKARAEVERQASLQLETTRSELATALAEVAKLKGQLDGKGKKERAPAPVNDVPAPRQSAPRPEAPPPQRVIRELSEQDKEKISRAEETARRERKKAEELEKELRQLKSKGDGSRQLKVARQEAQLAKDKFRAVEKRLNRTLLERDLTLRALKDLEKKSGITAERVELTRDEIDESDRSMDQKQQAEEKAEKEAAARAEASAVAAEQTAAAAASAAAAAAAAPAPVPASGEAAAALEKKAEPAVPGSATATEAGPLPTPAPSA